MNRPETPLAELANPQSANTRVFRDQLSPALLDILGKNTHNPFPQGIFETGTVVIPDASKPLGVGEPLHVAIAFTGPNADFNKAKGFAQAIAETFGLELITEASRYPFLKTGRQAEVKMGKHHGFAGEVDAKVAAHFGLSMGACIVEIEWIND